MRVLLISDTHGKLGIINQRAEQTRADAVVHAGDFGFHDRRSVERVSVREVAIHILHSRLSRNDIREAKKMNAEELRAFAAERLRMSELPEYIEGKHFFHVPVHAVWGNHEDVAVVEALRRGEIQVENLQLLDERAVHEIGSLRLFGLGGNVIAGPKLFHEPLAGHGGKIWTTLAQMGRLLELAKEKRHGEVRILVTHVSPGKEPLVARLAVHLKADFMVSGHMGSPYCVVWNEFGIREFAATREYLEARREVVERAWREVGDTLPAGENRRLAERGMEILSSLPGLDADDDPKNDGRRPWFRRLFAINLPDAPDGHAVLSLVDGRVELETFSTGRASSAHAGAKR